MQRTRRSSAALATGAVAVAAILALAVAIPAVGQDPTPTPAPAASEKPGKGPRADKAPKVPAVPISVSGRVGTRTDADGDTVYTLTVGATVYDLQVGPPWWWGESHPLKDLVGKTAAVSGERAQGTTDVAVFTVDGKAVREAGRPPWAGGWKAVGEQHPGWSQSKADRFAEKHQGKGLGRPPWAGPRTPEDAGD